jgi:predicted metal-binding protein
MSDEMKQLLKSASNLLKEIKSRSTKGLHGALEMDGVECLSKCGHSLYMYASHMGFVEQLIETFDNITQKEE